MAVISALGKLRQEACKLQASLDYIVRFYLKNKTKQDQNKTKTASPINNSTILLHSKIGTPME
jgi:hypothetical protein